MATSAPKWAKNAVATTRGWVVKGELVKAQKMTQEQADALNGTSALVVVPVMEPAPVLEPAPIAVAAPAPVEELVNSLIEE